MRVPRESDCIRIVAQQFCDRSIVSSPSPSTVASVLRMSMLDVEERLFASQLGIMLLEELLKSRDVILILPMCSDEVIALNRLHPNGLIGFPEALFPSLCSLRSDALSLRDLFSDALYRTSPSVSLHIVIAIDEKRFSPLPVQAFVLRKDLEPRVGNHLKLRDEPLVGHIPSNDNTVHFVLAEVLECVDESLSSICTTKMNVADDSDDEVGLSQSRNLVSQAGSAEISRTRKDSSTLKEFSAIHNL